MKRYAIKHIPTNSFLYEDEGGVFLLDEEEAFITYGKKKDAYDYLSYIQEEETYSTDEGEIDSNEFEVTEI